MINMLKLMPISIPLLLHKARYILASADHTVQ